MTETSEREERHGVVRPARPRPGPHRAWLVAGVTLLALVAAAAFRSTTGALFEPLEAEFGWTRAETSGAVTANLVIYGLVAPFAAVLMERFTLRKVVAAALLLVAAGSGATTVMTAAWQLWVLWGVFIGVGTGMLALVFGAVVANRWFAARRGLVMGFFSAANACGQLIFLPVVVHLAAHEGWRTAALLVAVFALAIVPLLAWPFANSPAEVGVAPFGASAPTVLTHDGAGSPQREDAPGVVRRNAAAEALAVLRGSLRSRAFWILLFTFWVCGWSTNGLMQTHFIPAAHDHGMPATTASGLLALIGVFDVIGTVASGWLTDRVRPWILLVAYYALRGASLLTVNALLGPEVEPPLWVFIVFYGLDWVATVPPTVALCREHFGAAKSSVVFGWVFASHMVGAGVGAFLAGWGREATGSYLPAWMSAAVLCFAAAASLFFLPPRTTRPSAARAAGAGASQSGARRRPRGR
ncbi:MFS transporter [Sinomonas cellulolyticus]|uniref:MFS transporter n=1 Tax=Sinomonas cellulolyticus TaxID=2801916 RepID=UPI0019C1B409|nr:MULTISPECIES: MFS transporter [Sinomonas]GHG54367.1 MFS transporter [Sinomonas sp. KCTC 49339]